jgi:hypothetical protein
LPVHSNNSEPPGQFAPKGTGPHRSPGSCCTPATLRSAQSRAPLRSAFLGHSSLKMTSHYVHDLGDEAA